MINKVENLRIEHKTSKAKLAREIGISKSQYYNYINGASLPYEVFEKIIEYFGYKVVIVKELK